MTKEEAIYQINQLAVLSTDKEIPKITEALDMAIEALSKPIVDITQRDLCKDISCEDCPFMQETCKLMDYVADAEAVQVVRCKECLHANECHKSVQYTRHELNTVTIGYSPIEWCSRGERKGGDNNEIDGAPTIDAVQVVRCKDCKYYDESLEVCRCSQWDLSRIEYPMVDADGFCSYGERRYK